MEKEIHGNCSKCLEILPHSKLRIVPVWFEEYGMFMTNRFCEKCFSEAFLALCALSNNDKKWDQLMQYLETNELTNLADELRKASPKSKSPKKK